MVGCVVTMVSLSSVLGKLLLCTGVVCVDADKGSNVLGLIELEGLFVVETILVQLTGGGRVNDSGMNTLFSDSCYVLGDHHACINLCGYCISCCLTWLELLHLVIIAIPVTLGSGFLFLAICIKYKSISVVNGIPVGPS